MIADVVTTKPVPVDCMIDGYAGIYFSVTVSRLESGLGHEGYACDKCGHKVKHVPGPRLRAKIHIASSIRQALANRDAELADLVTNALRFGAVKLKDGTPVLYSHADMIAAVARASGREAADVGPEWDQLLDAGA